MKDLSDVEFQLLAMLGTGEKAGRQIASDYHSETKDSLSYGTLYTTLSRLKDSGYLKVREGSDEDGRVRYYSITGEGSRALRSARKAYLRLAAFGTAEALP